MVLGIDASRFAKEYSTGVEMYSYHIIRSLLKAIQTKSDPVFDEVILYTPVDIPERLLGGSYPFCKVRVIELPRLWTQVRLSAEIIREKPDALFIPSHTLPIAHPSNSCVMIHDVAFKHFRKAYGFFQYSYLNFSTWLAVKEAKSLLVPSEATKEDLIQLFKCKENKVHVVPHGFEKPQFSEISNIQLSPRAQRLLNEKVDIAARDFLQRFGIFENKNISSGYDPYFLFVGRLEEKKNIVGIIRAFALFAEKHPHWKLLLVGRRGLGFKRIEQEIDHFDLWGNVILPGYATEEEKDIFFQTCSGFVFPSLYEGFGLPVLEAFHYEKPVVMSERGALREVAGNAGFFIDPDNEKSIALAMEKISKGGSSVTRKVNQGKERVKSYRWCSSAKRTLKVLEKMVVDS